MLEAQSSKAEISTSRLQGKEWVARHRRRVRVQWSIDLGGIFGNEGKGVLAGRDPDETTRLTSISFDVVLRGDPMFI